MGLDRYLQRVWYGKAQISSLLLLPLSWLFGLIAATRRVAFRADLFKRVRVTQPVIVIGNITVGGTGKTPFTIWLAHQLSARGLRVGIVLRGNGGNSPTWPRRVTVDTPWEEVGDEAILYAMRTSAIVIAGPDRVEDAREAIAAGAQIVLSDDGLQHYRLQRDAEILVIDEQRALGNRRLLPAGPLRESYERCNEVDLRVITRRGSAVQPSHAASDFGPPVVLARAGILGAVRVRDGAQRPLSEFRGKRIHALAAIGHPEAFFGALRELGLDIEEHPLDDHAKLRREDIVFDDDAPVLMTEKDAVKCRAIADERHWAVPLQVELSDHDAAIVSTLLERLLRDTG